MSDLAARWLIDLEGLRDVDICNAYADAQNTSYPGEPKEREPFTALPKR